MLYTDLDMYTRYKKERSISVGQVAPCGICSGRNRRCGEPDRVRGRLICLVPPILSRPTVPSLRASKILQHQSPGPPFHARGTVILQFCTVCTFLLYSSSLSRSGPNSTVRDSLIDIWIYRPRELHITVLVCGCFSRSKVTLLPFRWIF